MPSSNPGSLSHSRFFGNQRGMTLMEIMIVIALIGMVIGMGVTRLGGNNRHLKQAVRRMTVLGQTLHNRAKLHDKTYRIAIHMNPDEEHSYWVESASGNVRILSEEKREELERLTEIQREQVLSENVFARDGLTKKELSLPEPLSFKRVEYAKKEEPIDEGMAYIYFFPQGLVQEAAIYISDGEKLNWTVAFHPITGRADVVSKDIPLREIRQIEEK